MENIADVKAIIEIDIADPVYKFVLCLSGEEESPHLSVKQPNELRQIKKKITFVNF